MRVLEAGSVTIVCVVSVDPEQNAVVVGDDDVGNDCCGGGSGGGDYLNMDGKGGSGHR